MTTTAKPERAMTFQDMVLDGTEFRMSEIRDLIELRALREMQIDAREQVRRKGPLDGQPRPYHYYLAEAIATIWDRAHGAREYRLWAEYSKKLSPQDRAIEDARTDIMIGQAILNPRESKEAVRAARQRLADAIEAKEAAGAAQTNVRAA